MRKKIVCLFSIVSGCLLLSGCGSSGAGGVTGSAKLVNGATTVARTRDTKVAGTVPDRDSGRATYQITPDTLTLTLNKIQFLGADNAKADSTLTDCTATFDRTKAGLASLKNCAFTVAPGTYYGMFLYVSPTVTATMNDVNDGGSNHFYTNGTGIVMSAPAGGVQASSFTYTASSGTTYTDGFSSLSVFATPLTVAAGSSPEITIVIDGIHSIKADVSGGTATFNGNGNTVGHPDYVASANGVGRVAYYIDNALPYAGAMTYTGAAFAKVFYGGDGAPTSLFHLMGAGGAGCNGSTSQAANVAAATFPLNLSNADPNLKYGGYLGRDATNNRIKWSRAASAAWASYQSTVTLDEKTTLGQTTNMNCVNSATDPAPAGGTFTGTIADPSAPNATVALKLVAD